MAAGDLEFLLKKVNLFQSQGRKLKAGLDTDSNSLEVHSISITLTATPQARVFLLGSTAVIVCGTMERQ